MSLSSFVVTKPRSKTPSMAMPRMKRRPISSMISLEIGQHHSDIAESSGGEASSKTARPPGTNVSSLQSDLTPSPKQGVGFAFDLGKDRHGRRYLHLLP